MEQSKQLTCYTFAFDFHLIGSLNSPLNMALRSRLPYIRQTIIGHNLSMQQIDNILHSIQRLFSDMTVEITRPFGAPVVLKITLERVLRAVILLRGLTSEWVLVKGLHEDFQTEDGKVDIWSESRYQVFRKVTENANAAMLHFYSPAHPDIALRSFMVMYLINKHLNLLLNFNFFKHILDLAS
jgi:mediator of RNA polymerase II transcription subunit 27